jgi:hypothetical protein
MASGWHIKGAFLSVLALLGFFPALASERLVIPFEVNEYDHMVVRLEVNGNDRATGIIDTAATFPMINRRTARLAQLPELEDNVPMISVLGLTGEEIYPVVELETLLVGNVAKKDLQVALNVDLNVNGDAECAAGQCLRRGCHRLRLRESACHGLRWTPRPVCQAGAELNEIHG